jgi:SAM-dependent methyltransferase
MSPALSHSDAAAAARSTSSFYDTNAREYFERTVSANLTHLYDRFLPTVRKGGRILDAGCGSGRDLRVFAERGFKPFGIDSSANLVRLAHVYSRVECEVTRLQDVAFVGEFDAVWACASLLHLRKHELLDALVRLKRALVQGGVFFASVQVGNGERPASDGRFYAYYSVNEFVREVETAGLVVADAWTSEDSLPRRPTVNWVNVLAHA